MYPLIFLYFEGMKDGVREREKKSQEEINKISK